MTKTFHALLGVHLPRTTIEEEAGHGQRAHFRLAWRAVVAIPGLLALIIFSTFNNFLGGTFMALLDPYGLELMSVEWWGIVYAICSVGFIVGGAVVARTGLISAFAVAPIAEFWLLPYMREGGGEERWAWLLGTGEARGIALVFIIAAVIGMAVTVAAFFSPAYRRVSRSFAETPPSIAQVEG